MDDSVHCAAKINTNCKATIPHFLKKYMKAEKEDKKIWKRGNNLFFSCLFSSCLKDNQKGAGKVKQTEKKTVRTQHFRVFSPEIYFKISVPRANVLS